ncbi:hypothetical protein WI71_15505 [Burkholderia diffusa]|nr:hypothetical protein WI71_15505 [Burkholderia diffusa]
MARKVRAILDDQLKIIDSTNKRRYSLFIGLVDLAVLHVLMCRPLRLNLQNVGPDDFRVWKRLQ